MSVRYDDDDERFRDAFDEHGICRDGKGIRVRTAFRDSVSVGQRPHVTDSQGGTLGLHRPGYRIESAGNIGDQRVRDDTRGERQRIYDEYDAAVSTAWQVSPTGFGSGELVGQREGDLCTINGFPGHLKNEKGKLQCVPDDQARSRGDAYAAYDSTMQEAWRNP